MTTNAGLSPTRRIVSGCAIVLLSTLACALAGAIIGVAMLWPEAPTLTLLPSLPAPTIRFQFFDASGFYTAYPFILAADGQEYVFDSNTDPAKWQLSASPQQSINQNPCEAAIRKRIERQAGRVSECHTAQPPGEFMIVESISFAIDKSGNVWTLSKNSVTLIFAVPLAVLLAPVGLIIGVVIVLLRQQPRVEPAPENT